VKEHVTKGDFNEQIGELAEPLLFFFPIAAKGYRWLPLARLNEVVRAVGGVNVKWLQIDCGDAMRSQLIVICVCIGHRGRRNATAFTRQLMGNQVSNRFVQVAGIHEQNLRVVALADFRIGRDVFLGDQEL
jgi:hypothetical protein